MFKVKGFLKICSKLTREHPCQSVISIKLLRKITLRHGCSPVNLLHTFRIPFTKNTSGWLLLKSSVWNIKKLFTEQSISKTYWTNPDDITLELARTMPKDRQLQRLQGRLSCEQKKLLLSGSSYGFIQLLLHGRN